MASYNELVKNLSHIRSFLRDFYVFGFKSRDDYDNKSLRVYDNEKRRVESWLGDYLGFRRTAEGKYVFISIDSRRVTHNPLFKAWKAKSFTNGDITLHFILFDIFTRELKPLSIAELIEIIDRDYLSLFNTPMIFDESTIRKKLKEYVDEGLLVIKKDGKKTYYGLNSTEKINPPKELLDFYSEVAPCGVIGSFLLDRKSVDGEFNGDIFSFKHHYMTSAIDSGILFNLFDIMSKKASAEITTIGNKRKEPQTFKVVPLKIFISVQNGRQYLMAWSKEQEEIKSYRLDYILKVKAIDVCDNIDDFYRKLEKINQHMWGVIGQKRERPQHVEFTVHAEDYESHIYKRLLREKRCGKVSVINKNTFHFSADVYDLNEMIPWLRTFIGRITDLQMEDKVLEKKFKEDVNKMYGLYDVGGINDVI